MILHVLRSFTTNLYRKYRPNSRLMKVEYSFCHSHEFLCVMVEYITQARVKTWCKITRYFTATTIKWFLTLSGVKK